MMKDRVWSARLIMAGWLLFSQSLLISAEVPGKEPAVTQISIVTDSLAGGCALHGLAKLTEILKAKKISFEKVSSLRRAKGKFILVKYRLPFITGYMKEHRMLLPSIQPLFMNAWPLMPGEISFLPQEIITIII